MIHLFNFLCYFKITRSNTNISLTQKVQNNKGKKSLTNPPSPIL